MSVIDIHRAHSLDKEHAREAAETLAKDLSKQVVWWHLVFAHPRIASCMKAPLCRGGIVS